MPEQIYFMLVLNFSGETRSLRLIDPCLGESRDRAEQRWHAATLVRATWEAFCLHHLSLDPSEPRHVPP